MRRRRWTHAAQVGLAQPRAGSHRRRTARCNAVAPGARSAISEQFTERPLGARRPRWYVPRADPFPGTRGRTERETAPAPRARRVEGSGTCRGRRRGCSRILHRCRDRRTGRRRRGGRCATVKPSGEHPTSGDAGLHDHPRRRHQLRVHRLGAAQHQLRPLARGSRPMVLPSGYASDPVPIQQLIITDEERGDRGLSQFAGLDPALNTAALTGAQDNNDPAPAGYRVHVGGLDLRPRLHAARRRLRLDVRRRVRRHQPRLHLAERLPGAGVTGTTSSAPGRPRAARRPRWATGTRASGQYTQIFMNQQDPADPLIDTLTPSTLPTPSTAAAPDVVQVSPPPPRARQPGRR